MSNKPTAKEMYEILYDDCEEVHIVTFGILEQHRDVYESMLGLFKATLTDEIDKALTLTRRARDLRGGGRKGGGDELLGTAEEGRGWCDEDGALSAFVDGSKIIDAITLFNDAKKNFDLVEPACLPRAKAFVKQIGTEQRRGVAVLLTMLRPLLPMAFGGLLLVGFDAAVGPALWASSATLVDGIAAGSMTIDDLGREILSMLVLFAFTVLVALAGRAFINKSRSQFQVRVRGALMDSLVRQDVAFFDVTPSGVLQERLNKDSQDLSQNFFYIPQEIVNHSAIVLSNAVNVHAISPQLLLIIALPLPVVALAQYAMIKFFKKMQKKQRKMGEEAAAATIEVIKEIRTVREFAMEGEEAQRYSANAIHRAGVEEHAEATVLIIFIVPLIMLFIVTRLFAVYNGGAMVDENTITVGECIQVATASTMMTNSSRVIMEFVPKIVKVLDPIGRTCEMMNSIPEIEPDARRTTGAGAFKPKSIEGRIEFRDVDFTFPSEPNKQVLKRLSFTAAAGQKVAFVGATGCGKSTSIKLLERFYNPDAGEILLDGRPLCDFDPHTLRRHMSCVAQDSVLFSTTIRENVVYGLPQSERDALTTAQVRAACECANAWEFISEFPKKLETFVGERGVKLSGGQRQRLALARAIIRRPTILLLDEATSALDAKNEKLVQGALDKLLENNSAGCALIIAHRLTTIKDCDMIVVMDRGHNVEHGSHAELLKIPITKSEDGNVLTGFYRDLWLTQTGEDTEALKERVKELERALKQAKPGAPTTDDD